MVLVRLSKVALVAAIALFFSLVAFGNITDYESNWMFVQHVLSMDTTFANSALHWRAVTNPSLQAAGYVGIIVAETVTAVLLWLGSIQLVLAVGNENFGRKKSIAVLGLTMGILLYVVGFISIGGEWFAMWQSQIWNGEQKAFDFVAMIGIVLVILLVPEQE
jgi:predicted small integral membrane protein